MNKYIVTLSLLLTAAAFSAPIPDNLGGICDCDDVIFDCLGDCEGCDIICDPLCHAVDCELTDIEEELEETEDLLEEDFDEHADEAYENGMFAAVEGTYADYEEVFYIDDETPFTNEVEIIPSWCE